jgi:hypothetical protein
MNLKELRNKARKGIEPERDCNSPLLPQKTFFGIDFGVVDSIAFVSKNRDAADITLREFKRLMGIDWNIHETR